MMKICINCDDYLNTSHNDDCRRSTYRHTPIKIVGGSFLQNAPGGLDAESDPCALTPAPNCNLLHVVRNMFLYARCCPQPIKAPLSQLTWPIHSPSQSMHQKSFVSCSLQTPRANQGHAISRQPKNWQDMYEK